MKINRSNYEVFFVDYFDGNLSEPAKQDLYAFLKKHPDLAEEFETYSDISLPAGQVTFPDKEKLKKPLLHTVAGITFHNYEDYLIAHSEGDLSPKEEKHLQQFITKNPQVAADASAYATLKLTPDKTISYGTKNHLKKSPLLVHFRRKAWLYGAAASVLLLVSILWLTPRPITKTTPVNRLATFTAEPIGHSGSLTKPLYRPVSMPVWDEDIKPAYDKQAPVTFLTTLPGPGQLPTYQGANDLYKRVEHTSTYFYHQIQEDLEYYVALQEYSKKSTLGRVAYQLENRLAGNGMYIADPVINNFDFSRESLSALNDISFNDLLPTKEAGKDRNRSRFFKSDLIEFSHIKGE